MIVSTDYFCNGNNYFFLKANLYLIIGTFCDWWAWRKMSQEKVLKILVSLGLTDWDAKVYVLLAKRGPIKARDAAKALKISKQRLYPLLKRLQKKGIVNSTIERPTRFVAVEFEKVLDSFLKARMEQARRIQENRDDILSDWNSIAVVTDDSSPAKFAVIEGKSSVYSRIQQMIQTTRENLSFVVTATTLARADQFGIFDAVSNHPLKSKIRFRFLSEISDQNASAMRAVLEKIPKTNFDIRGKAPDLGLKLCPQIVIKDEAEAMFFIDRKESKLAGEQDDVCLWTNCKSLVNGFLAMFDDLWLNAMDIEKRIVTIETGKSPPEGHIICDAKRAYEKYHEALHAAEEEIIIITSEKGLVDFWKVIDLVKNLVERGVSIKIMAPIGGRNVEAAQELLKFCEVRNVSSCYQETTIIDGKRLFQFKTPPSVEERKEKPETNTYFGNIFHTNDHEYVERMKKMLNSNWKNAYLPSNPPWKNQKKLRRLVKMKESVVNPFSGRENIIELKRIIGLKCVRLTLNREVNLTVDEKVTDTLNHVFTHGITWDVELAIEDGPTLIGKAFCERESILVTQEHGKNMILRDYYEFSFPECGGFKGNALIILENVSVEKLWEKSKAYALFKGIGKFEGQTLNVGHPWQDFMYPIIWTGYLLKP